MWGVGGFRWDWEYCFVWRMEWFLWCKGGELEVDFGMEKEVNGVGWWYERGIKCCKRDWKWFIVRIKGVENGFCCVWVCCDDGWMFLVFCYVLMVLFVVELRLIFGFGLSEVLVLCGWGDFLVCFLLGI